MRRAIVAGTILAALVLSPMAAANRSGDDIVTLNVSAKGADRTCPVLNFDVCPTTWDTNGTAAPGDDRVTSSVFVDDVRVGLHPPGGFPGQQVVVDPRDIEIHHPIYHDLNQTWLALNDSEPDATRAYFEFESHQQRTCNEDAGEWDYGDDWGIFLTIYKPRGVATSCDSTEVIGWCWDYCSLDHETYMRQTDDSIRPFPNGILLLADDGGNDVNSDYTVGYDGQDARNCFFVPVVPCELQPAWPLFDIAEQAYFNSTPNVQTGFEVNRTTAAVNSDYLNVSTFSPNANEYRGVLPEAYQGVPLRIQDSSPTGGDLHWGMPAATGPMVAPPPHSVPPVSPPQVQSTQGHTLAASKTTLILLAAGAGTTLFVVVGWFLYHRISQREGLEQEARHRIHQALVAEPGLRVGELARRVGLAEATVAYHLRKMETWHLVRAEDRGRPRYYPIAKSREEARRWEVLAQPTPRAVHNALADGGEADHSTLAAMLDVSLVTIGRAVAKLEAESLVTQTRVGKRVIVRSCVLAAQGACSGAPPTQRADG